jgi:hypothetical protein
MRLEDITGMIDKRVWIRGTMVLLAAAAAIASEPAAADAERGLALAIGSINDNWTGSVENGIAGRYIGADDFLTFGLFALGRLDRFDLDLHYQMITSRKFGWRYDLIHAGLGYFFQRSHWLVLPRVGLLFKGNWGGESLQNGVHRCKGLPEVDLPYLAGDFAPSLGGRLDYRGLIGGKSALTWRATAECELPWAIKPLWVSASLGGQAACRFALLELDGGWRQYLNQRDHYSELVRSGWFGGFRVILRFKAVAGGGGLSFFPARNLDNDPLFADQNWDWSPQFWKGGGLNADVFSLRDVVYY